MFRPKRLLPSGPQRRVLLLQLGRLGDVIASRLALHSLATAWRDAAVELVVPAACTSLFGPGEPVAAVHAYQGVGFEPSLALLRSLRRPRADLVVDLTGTPPSRWLCLGSGARRRAGWGRRWLYAYGTDDLRRRDAGYPMEIARLIRALGVEPVLDPPPLRPAPASPGLADVLAGIPERPVVLHPGASNPIRHWRGNRFARLAERLDAIGVPVLLVVGPQERTLAAGLVAECRVPLRSFVACALADLTAALAAARLVVALDSGPMHLACALGVPTLALFGPNLPLRAAPISGPLSVLEVPLECRPCSQILERCVLPDYNCMDRIEVEAVVQRAQDLLRLP
jgi:ADP-heptose:LPS heptosyltransferase